MSLSKIEREAKSLIKILMDEFRSMTVAEVAVFKACLISLGVLIGTYFSKTLKRFAPVFWVVFIASYLVMIYRFIVWPLVKKR